MAKYHHGDLRNVLIAIATELLAEEGTQGLSLRKIAQKAGVSHNAPYMHFADKEAVLSAIAEEGFRLLAIEVESAIATADNDTREQIIAASTAYVNFAIARPNHLKVMFYPYDPLKHPGAISASQASLNRLLELVETGQENRMLISGNSQEMTKAIWAMVHGIAAISIAYKTNVLVADNMAIAGTVSIFVNLLLDGLATRSQQPQ
jgi:AcrR family transcriptional regulator